MVNEIAKRDSNYSPSMIGVTNDSAEEIRRVRIDPTTGGIVVKITGGIPNIYTADGILTGNRTVDQDSNELIIRSRLAGDFSTIFQDITENKLQSETADASAVSQAVTSVISGVTTALIDSSNSSTSKSALVSATSTGIATIEATDSFIAKTPAVNASTATVGQVLTLQDATTGELEYADVPSDKSEYIIIVASDEKTLLTVGRDKTTFRIPWTGTITGVRASVTTAPTGAALTVDINKTGIGTILSTKITIDATERTSVTAAIAPVISTAGVTDDDEYTIDIDTIGSTIAGTGLKITILGTRS